MKSTHLFQLPTPPSVICLLLQLPFLLRPQLLMRSSPSVDGVLSIVPHPTLTLMSRKCRVSSQMEAGYWSLMPPGASSGVHEASSMSSEGVLPPHRAATPHTRG
jgi:hypothetical protein